MAVIKYIRGAVESAIQKEKVNWKLYRTLIGKFSEGESGLKNLGIISNTLKKYIKGGHPEKAVDYAKHQREKIDQQTHEQRFNKLYKRAPQ